MANSANYKNNTGVRVTKGNYEQIQDNLKLLADLEVLVGFPEDTTERDKDPDDPEEDRGITNAALGYIHDNGSPEAHIPARPFMVPAIQENQKKIEQSMSGALKQAMRGDAHRMEQAMVAAGLTAKLAIQKQIASGIPPPLSDKTLKKRAARGKNSSIAKAAQIELNRREAMRAFGEDPFFDMGTALTTAKPLNDTGQMRNAVNFVIRSKKKRRG
jgi:hypothetical protein